MSIVYCEYSVGVVTKLPPIRKLGEAARVRDTGAVTILAFLRPTASQCTSRGTLWVYRLPIHISKMVLPTIHVGPPKGTRTISYNRQVSPQLRATHQEPSVEVKRRAAGSCVPPTPPPSVIKIRLLTRHGAARPGGTARIAHMACRTSCDPARSAPPYPPGSSHLRLPAAMSH